MIPSFHEIDCRLITFIAAGCLRPQIYVCLKYAKSSGIFLMFCSFRRFLFQVRLSVCFLGNAISTTDSSWVTVEAMTTLGVADMSLILSFILTTAWSTKIFSLLPEWLCSRSQ